MAKRIETGRYYRDFNFVDGSIDKEARTVRLTFSSEHPVMRGFGYEILDHSTEAVDMTRLSDGAPLLLNHNSDDQIGVVESAHIRADRKGEAVVRFGKSAKAEEVFQDVVDKVRRKVSVGYFIKEMVREGKRDGVEAFRATRWCPLEITVASIPADNGVGIGRATEQKFQTEIMNERSLHLDADPAIKPASGGADRAQIERELRKEWETDNFKRCEEINAIAERAVKSGRPQALEMARAAVAKGTSIVDFKAQVMEECFRAIPITTPNSADIGMSKQEAKRFSLLRACYLKAQNLPLDGIEKEACDAAQKQMRRTLSSAESFVLPAEVSRYHDELAFRHMIMQRAQNVGTAAAGGFTVETEYGPLIELLRNQTALGQVGITIIDGIQGDFVMPVQTGGCTAYWVSETGSITDSEATFGQKTMVPHRLGASVPFTTQFLAQTSLSAEAFLRGELDTVMNLKKDLAGLLGTGVGGEPLGVANTTGINATVTYGGAATWADIVEHETGINVDNADIGSMAFIIDAATTGKWKTILKDSVAGAGYLLSDNMTANGYPVKRTQQIVTAHQSFFGVWKELILGLWAGREITVDNLTLKKQGQHQIIIQELCDFLVRQPLAFNISTDSAAQ